MSPQSSVPSQTYTDINIIGGGGGGDGGGGGGEGGGEGGGCNVT